VRVLDISLPLRDGMPVYPGDPPVRISLAASLAAGDPYNVTRLELGAHTGTHVDAPLHLLEGGGGVETLELEALVGPARVVEDDAELPPGVERVLFRTGGAELTPARARRLVAAGVRLVGVDSSSVGGEETHDVLLSAGVVVLEGLDLRRAGPGAYTLVCLPLLVPGADGAPARAVLLSA
jgi:arylformamidase